MFRLVLSISVSVLSVVFPVRWVAAADRASGAERPNILWITVEDMSPTLGCWADAYASTPNIDRLARESVKYTQVFATAPVCSPVRSCLITGCYATSLGTQRLRSAFPIPKKMKGFPALLRQAGYYCTNNVKTDYNTSREPEIIKASWNECSPKAHWRNREPGQPFFAVFNDMTTHQSRTMVWPYKQFQREVQSHLTADQIHDPSKAPLPPYYPDTPLARKTVARYYDCVSVMDQHVGELLKQLEEDGLSEQTIVFFYSDHGSGMPRHKRALFDSGMHVPLLVRFLSRYRMFAPAQPGGDVDRLVSFVDFPPSVLAFCGVDIPDYMQGRPLLSQYEKRLRDCVFGARDRVDEVFDLARSVRDHRYLYIRNYMPHLSYHQPSWWPGQSLFRQQLSQIALQDLDAMPQGVRQYLNPTRPLEELYDVQTDPLNLHNLAGSKAHQDVLGAMRHRLHREIVETRDLGFLPEEQVWSRLATQTPYDMARDQQRYPQMRLLDAASLVGTGPGSIERLVRGLSDAEPGVRYWSAVGLAALGRKAKYASTALAQTLEDPSAAVRIEAAGALARMGESSKALPVLVTALQGRDISASLHAARTLELLGPVANPVAPAMQAIHQRMKNRTDVGMFVFFATDDFLKTLAEP